MRLLCTITAYPPSTGGDQVHLHGLLTQLRSTQPEVVSLWDRNRTDWLMGTTLRAESHDLRYCLDGIPVDRLGVGWGEEARAVPAVPSYCGATRLASRALARPLADVGVRPGAIEVIGGGPVLAETADGARFRARYGNDGPLVLFVGQHYAYKGFGALLAAAPLVWPGHPDAVFAFVGPAVGRSERAFGDVDGRVVRLGVLDLQAKSDALAAADVLCVPSTQESFGAVLTEAWSLGTPVVAGDIPATREVVDEGVDGFLVPQKPAAIAENVSWLLDHPADARRMGEAGREKVEARYSWSVLAAALERVYAEVA